MAYSPPHRRPNRYEIPISPVFTGDSPGSRVVGVPSPYTEEIRQHLLILLEAGNEQNLKSPCGQSVRPAVDQIGN